MNAIQALQTEIATLPDLCTAVEASDLLVPCAVPFPLRLIQAEITESACIAEKRLHSIAKMCSLVDYIGVSIANAIVFRFFDKTAVKNHVDCGYVAFMTLLRRCRASVTDQRLWN